MNIELERINEIVQIPKDKMCLVVGDIILDKYLVGEVNRISPEAPVPIVSIKSRKNVLGGAANVAANISGYGANVSLIGIIGKDSHGEELLNLANETNIIFNGIISDNRETIAKTRIVGQDKQMLRIDEENTESITCDEEDFIINKIKEIIPKVEVIVLSDYGKGVCTDRLCMEIIKIAKEKNKYVLVDTKRKNWDVFNGATLIKPNFKEFKNVVGEDISNTEEDIVKFATKLMKKHALEGILVTRSKYGMTYVGNKNITFDSLEKEVYDVSGAGDTVIATVATFITEGVDIEKVIEMSNIAAGIAITKFGTYRVTLEELREQLNINQNSLCNKIADEKHMQKILKEWRNSGEKIVFTNGCFDILHKGHILNLLEAKKHGDKLIVGLNSDKSVKALKGEERPINKEEDRAMLLAALSCVDLIVIFNDDTPYELVKLIKPDVMVKGGDYKVEDIAGHEFAKEVVIFPIIEGYSTTSVIKKIEK